MQKKLHYHKSKVHQDLKFHCTMCEYQSHNQSNVNKHRKKLHNAGANFQCKLCEFKASTMGSIEIHAKSIHEGLIYACKECNYKQQINQH